MRRIERTASFKRDYKREAKGRYRSILADELQSVIKTLVADQPLEACYRDHALAGAWKAYRECHIKPDLLLIYQKTNDNALALVRLGSHSNLFG